MSRYKRKIIVAITGASGARYAFLLLDRLLQLKDQIQSCAVVCSSNATEIWNHELNVPFPRNELFQYYDKNDFSASFASGSSTEDTMIICPASMGCIGRIASAVADDLITRAADVMLKERRKLIIVPRETPYHLIHLENMQKITHAGGIISPASPSFYHQPRDIDSLLRSVTDRVLQLAGFEMDTYRWGEQK